MTVVLDTNVLVSALIHPGSVRSLVYRLVETNVSVAISDYIIRETKTVLERPKFHRRRILTKLWEELKPVLIIVTAGNGKSPKSLRDPKDHPILLSAQKAKADYIITGDNDLLVLKRWLHTRIITISQCQKLLTTQENLPALDPKVFSPQK